MTESRYKIIQLNQNVHTDQEEDDSDEEEDVSDNLDDDTVTIIPANDRHDLHFPQKFSETSSNMQTPTAILTLILIYFTLSIGLTFYQRDFLKVRDHSNLYLFICSWFFNAVSPIFVSYWYSISYYLLLFLLFYVCLSVWVSLRADGKNRNSISHLWLYFII